MFRIIVVFCLLFIIGSFFGLLVISIMKSKKKWLKAIAFIIAASAFASIFTFVIIDIMNLQVLHRPIIAESMFIINVIIADM